jgi:hypothetical protein
MSNMEVQDIDDTIDELWAEAAAQIASIDAGVCKNTNLYSSYHALYDWLR